MANIQPMKDAIEHMIKEDKLECVIEGSVFTDGHVFFCDGKRLYCVGVVEGQDILVPGVRVAVFTFRENVWTVSLGRLGATHAVVFRGMNMQEKNDPDRPKHAEMVIEGLEFLSSCSPGVDVWRQHKRYFSVV